MKIKNQRDFFSGLVFMGAGAAAAWIAPGLRIGTAERMGPGYFPLALGIALAVLGGFIAFTSLVFETEDGGAVEPWSLRPLACVAAGSVLFGVLLGGLPRFGVPPLGLVLAVYASTLIASLAADGFKFRQAALLATACVVAAWLVLVQILDIAVPLWPVLATR
jgi:hypothetical protein